MLGGKFVGERQVHEAPAHAWPEGGGGIIAPAGMLGVMKPGVRMILRSCSAGTGKRSRSANEGVDAAPLFLIAVEDVLESSVRQRYLVALRKETRDVIGRGAGRQPVLRHELAP